MTTDLRDLQAELTRANAYTLPARIVRKYKAINGLTMATEVPGGVTMQEMLRAVVAADFSPDPSGFEEAIVS